MRRAAVAVVLTVAFLARPCCAALHACGARCGVSWDEANTTCQAPCSTESGEQCPPGLSCWSGLSSAPCDGHREEVCATRCGETWDDANSRCLAPCSSDPKEQCPAGLFCWSGLSNLPCEGGGANATARRPRAQPPAVASPAPSSGKGRTLVVYVVVDTDPEYWNNFLHFAREGMKPGPKETAADTHYVIAIQSDDPLRMDVGELPTLPSNAAFVFPNAGCSSWGAYGWVLRSGQVDVDQFSYFIFITSTVRGPFMPAYTQGILDWKHALLDALDSDTKLVGSTIACDGLRSSQGTASNPYVQSYAVATDWVGLGILRKGESMLGCDFPHSAAAAQAEVAASRSILDAGYNIASLMARYQGIDWRDKNKWGCNRGRDPTLRYLNDGVNVNMFEVVFVKYRHADRFLKEPHALKAAQMELAHVASKGAKHVLDASDRRNSHDSAARQVCFSQMWGAKQCFDDAKVRASRPEYAELSDREAWARYVALDQFADSGAGFECSQHPDPKPLVYEASTTKRVR